MELSRESPSGIKLSFHIVGWLIFFFAPVILSPGRDMEAYFSEPPIITSLVVRNILLMIFFYANLFYLTPKLFAPKSQVIFFFVIGLLIVVVGSVNYYIHEILNGTFEGFGARPPRPSPDFGPGGDFPPGNPPPRRLMLASPYFSSLLITALVATASTLLVLWNNWIKAKEDEQERTLQKVAAELSMLKLQISPHFLFNTLNNIRWLVRSKSENAEPAIVKLSQLLRYILYQVDGNFVSLDKEVEHLQDYVSLQKMRLEENGKINFNIEGDLLNRKIVPLLLIPLVENFFKHGDFVNADRSAIDLTVHGQRLTFKTINKMLLSDKDAIDSGIGIDNLKKRLALHYPGNYTFKQWEEGGNYFVTLEINLN
jgi:Histidine kinase